MKNMTYKNISDMWFVLVPLLTIIILWLGYQKKSKILLYMKIPIAKGGFALRLILIGLGLGLIFYSLLGPQREVGIREVKGQGLDMYVLMDTSKSMLATDVVPSRIERSKKIVQEMIEHISGDRIGFIPFASSAYIQMPLTDDYTLASMFLNVVDTDMIGGGGTDLTKAIKLALDSFEETGSVNKVLVIISDGEALDIDYGAVNDLIDGSDAKIFTIGVGTPEGGLIPVYDRDGRTVLDYKKDQSGEVVMTRLDETTLRNIANKSGAQYYLSTIGLDEVEALMASIEQLNRSENSVRKIKEYKQLYQWFLGAGLVMLILGLKLPERRKL